MAKTESEEEVTVEDAQAVPQDGAAPSSAASGRRIVASLAFPLSKFSTPLREGHHLRPATSGQSTEDTKPRSVATAAFPCPPLSDVSSPALAPAGAPALSVGTDGSSETAEETRTQEGEGAREKTGEEGTRGSTFVHSDGLETLDDHLETPDNNNRGTLGSNRPTPESGERLRTSQSDRGGFPKV